MSGPEPTERTDSTAESDRTDRPADAHANGDGFPWYVKAAIAAALLVVLAVVVIDLAKFAGVG